MDKISENSLFLTDKGYLFYHPTYRNEALLKYGLIIMEFYELSEKLENFKTALKEFPSCTEIITQKNPNDFIPFFRDTANRFIPTIMDWLSLILFDEIYNPILKYENKKTFSEIIDNIINDLKKLSNMSEHILQILSSTNISDEDYKVLASIFRNQEMKVRFEINEISHKTDMLFLVEDVYSFIALEAHTLQKFNYTIKECRHCCKFFIPDKSDTLTCDRISPQYPEKTCKEAAKHIKRLKRENNDEMLKQHKIVYNMKLAKYNNAKDSGNKKLEKQLYDDLYNNFIPTSSKFRKDVKNGTKSKEEYLKWLNGFKKRKKDS